MSDLDIIMEYWNNYEIRKYLGVALPMSLTAEREWLESSTKLSPWKDGRIVLTIEEKQTGNFLGTTSLFDISSQSRHAELGIAIHQPKNHSKGYGTDATRVTLWVGFHVLGLNSVYLYALAHNQRAIRAYEKTGFKHIGVFRQATFVEGEFKDLVAMDILSEEFMEQFPPGAMTGEL